MAINIKDTFKQTIVDPFKHLVELTIPAGVLLIMAVTAALLVANSAFAPFVNSLLHVEFGFSIGNFHFIKSSQHWVNDGLMSFFFLLVGLEIKRELLEGDLSTMRQAFMPVFAAIGGMLIPIFIFNTLNVGNDSEHGWAIPMATDIAFALGIYSLLGNRVPFSLKVFLAALAVIDDLGAIIIIALVYGAAMQLNYLLMAAFILAVLIILNKTNRFSWWIFAPLGLALWYCICLSGIHATIAGVLLAFTIPLELPEKASPLLWLQQRLRDPVNFIIMPLFAFVNTGIVIDGNSYKLFETSLGWGIILGLVLGKPIGIGLFSWLSVKIGLGQLPQNATWKQLIGVGCIAGIGFTMSIFISLLSFQDQALIDSAKVAVLIASSIAGLGGFCFLWLVSKKKID